MKGLFPREDFDSVYLIPYETYQKNGIRGVIFDIDNTLAEHGAPAGKKIKALFERLRRLGMKTCLLSNNGRERVESFAREVDSPFIEKAGKPATASYRRALSILDLSPRQVLSVGDQIFTDVWGSNRAGIYSILVKPVHPREELQIRAKRQLEKAVIYLYEKRKRKRND